VGNATPIDYQIICRGIVQMSDTFSQCPCAKGPVLYGLDEMSKSAMARENLERLHRAVEELRARSFSGLENVFESALFTPLNVVPQDRRNWTSALAKYWFDENSPSAYFRTLQPIAPTYAEGVLKTIELSLRGDPVPTPIDAWWIMGYSHVELLNLVSSKQVTLLVMTPTVASIRKLIGEGEAWTTVRGIVTRKL
jgi:hypothetical protein